MLNSTATHTPVGAGFVQRHFSWIWRAPAASAPRSSRNPAPRLNALATAALFALVSVALLAPRPAHAMIGFLTDLVANYQAPVTKINVMCANCHADWAGAETRGNLGVDSR